MASFPCRLWLFVPKDGQTVIVLRRGPHGYSRLTCWNTRQDSLTHGQWLKANIDTQSCDVSPNSEFFAYSVRYAKQPPHLWVAISRPPYFSALAMWPISDAWGGDATFVDNRQLCISQGQAQTGLDLTEGFTLKKFVLVEGPYGSDWRWFRDGWRPIIPAGHPSNWGKFFLTWEKVSPKGEYVLRRCCKKDAANRPGHGLGNAFYYELACDADCIPLEGINCADWDQKGRILMTTRSGTVQVAEVLPSLKLLTSEIADLNNQTFEKIAAPDWATSW